MTTDDRYTIDPDGVLRPVFGKKAGAGDATNARRTTAVLSEPEKSVIPDPATFTWLQTQILNAMFNKALQFRQCWDVTHTFRHHVTAGSYIASISFGRSERGLKKTFAIEPYRCRDTGATRYALMRNDEVHTRCRDFDHLKERLNRLLRLDEIGVIVNMKRTRAPQSDAAPG